MISWKKLPTSAQWIPIFFTLLLSSEVLWARAGGAGGGGHGGGGGGGDAGAIFYLIELVFDVFFHFGPIGVIVLVLLIVGIAYYFSSRSTDIKSAIERTSFGAQALQQIQTQPNVHSANTPSFLQGPAQQEFQSKVARAFVVIQDSWTQKRLDLMRKFITDGVYQRFNAQFIMMNLLQEKNPVTQVHVNHVQILNSTQEGGYDCVDVLINATATDQFISEKFPQLNTPGGTSTFSECWSFLRRHDYVKGVDLYHSDNCPKCSASLTSKLMETARCPYCGTYLNSGEYDWVLSEITQEEDYQGVQVPLDLTEVQKIYPAFSVHAVEDRASNAVMQILIGGATRDTARLKRFTTAPAFEILEKSLPAKPVAYSRLYARSVSLLKTEVAGQQVRCHVSLTFSYQLISLNDSSVRIPDPEDLASETRLIVLVRNISEAVAKGSIYANSCPSCGATQTDSLSAVCTYCNSPLNDANLDWIVDSFT